jgi:Domain of unknown function (DUF4440)
MNRTLRLLCTLFTVIAAPLGAQQTSSPSATPPTKAEQEILDLSRTKWRWMADKQVDSLAPLFHDKASFVHMSRTMTRDQELEVIRTGNIHYKHAEIFESSARFIDNTAIVLQRIRLDAVVGGNEVTTFFSVTEVYVKQRGAWKLGVLAFSRLAQQTP